MVAPNFVPALIVRASSSSRWATCGCRRDSAIRNLRSTAIGCLNCYMSEATFNPIARIYARHIGRQFCLNHSVLSVIVKRWEIS